jgi:hypothetical protein
METKPLDRTVFLELENMSLKLRIMQTNFQQAASKALADAGLSPEEWAIDLDQALFVQRPK